MIGGGGPIGYTDYELECTDDFPTLRGRLDEGFFGHLFVQDQPETGRLRRPEKDAFVRYLLIDDRSDE